MDCYGEPDSRIEPMYPYCTDPCDVYLFDRIFAEGELLLLQWSRKDISRNALRFHAERLGVRLIHYSEYVGNGGKM